MNKKVKGPELSKLTVEKYVFIPLTIALDSVISCEHQINKKDIKSYNMGTKFKKAANSLHLIKNNYSSKDIIYLYIFFDDIAKTLMQSLGPDLGDFYYCIFKSMSSYLSTFSCDQELNDELWMKTLGNIAKQLQNRAQWHIAFMFITEIQQEYNKGDKFIDAFGKAVENVQLIDDCDAETHVLGVWLRAVYEGFKLNIF